MSENFTTLLAFAGEIGDPRLAAAHRFAVAFLHGRHAQLAARVAAATCATAMATCAPST